MARNESPQPHQPSDAQPSGPGSRRAPTGRPAWSQSPQEPPQPLTPGWLSAHFDPLPFPARTSALARYARALAPDAYAALHRTLDAGPPHERHTALFLAVARRDLPTVGAALADPVLRRRALSAAIRLPVPDEPLEQLALSPARAVRHDTYRVLRLSRRTALAAALLPRVHERYGADDAARLLPACSSTTVDDWLIRIDPPLGVLRTLARTAPLVIALHVAARLARLDAHDGRAARVFAGRYSAVASIAARRDPDAALVLLRHAPFLLKERAAYAALRRPAEALDALREAQGPGPVQSPDPAVADTATTADAWRRELSVPPGPLPRSVRKALRTLAPAELSELVERCTEGSRRSYAGERVDVAPDGILMLLPPAERRRIVLRKAERHRSGLTALSITLLAALEPADRAALLAPYRERWAGRARATTRNAVALPLDLAEPALRDLATQHPLHHRFLAWPALLACAELNADPAEFARIAADCERAWHDRDEIRRRTLTQLAGAPHALLAALPLHVLRDAALTAVQSRDSSRATLAAAGRLLRRTTLGAIAHQEHENAAYSAGLLCQVLNDPRHPRHSSRPGTPHNGPRDPHPSRSVPALRLDTATAQAIWAAMRATDAPHTSKDLALCVTLAELLAPHLEHLPELDARVRHIALHADDPTLAARAADAWVAPAALREQRCAELVGHDVSFAAVPRVLNTLTNRRTDLLDPVLEAAPGGLTGHLRPRPTPWAPRITPSATDRWLPDQRRALNEHYARVALDESVPLHTRADAAAQLRSPELLATLADEAPQPVAAAALTALGAASEPSAPHAGEARSRHTGDKPSDPPTDAQDPVTLLLHHAGTGGVRGRAAMASLRHLLDARPADEAVTLLRSVLTTPGTPVGSRKEAARALGELPDPAAFDALLAAWDTDGQHRDVRAAMARPLLARIDRPDVAERLAARMDEPALREIVLHTRVVDDSQYGPYAAVYVSFLTQLLRSPEADRHTVVAVCGVLPNWCAGDAEEPLRTLVEVITGPARVRGEWNAAAVAAARLPAYSEDGQATLRALWQTLLDRVHGAAPPQRADALRRLIACVDAFRRNRTPGYAAVSAAVGTEEAFDGLADALERVGLHARAAHLRLHAAVVALRNAQYRPERWDRLLRALEQNGTALLQVPDMPLGRRGGHRNDDISRAVLTAARDLRTRGTRTAGQLALALVEDGGDQCGWTAEWQAELDALRGHPDAETALEAWLVEPRRP